MSTDPSLVENVKKIEGKQRCISITTQPLVSCSQAHQHNKNMTKQHFKRHGLCQAWSKNALNEMP